MTQNHNSNQSPDFFEHLNDKASKNDFIKDSPSLFMPFIGDKYSEKGILVIAGRPEHYGALKKYKENSPKGNYCDYLMKSSDKRCQKLQKDILNRMKSVGLKEIKINNISFYNFQFKPNEKNAAQWLKGEDLKKLYNIFINDIIGILNPKKIFFYRDAYDGINTRLKKPNVFGNKNLDEFLKSKQIEIYREHKSGYDNVVALLNTHWFLSETVDFMQNHLQQDNNQFNSCIKQMQRYLSEFKVGIDGIISNLSRAEQEKISLPRDVSKLQIMLTYLQKKNLYIHYALVPQFMDFVDDLYSSNKLYRHKHIIENFEKKSVKDISLDDAKAIEKKLKSIINKLHTKVNKKTFNQYKRIFKSASRDNESVKICSPSEYKQIHGHKSFFKKK